MSIKEKIVTKKPQISYSTNIETLERIPSRSFQKKISKINKQDKNNTKTSFNPNYVSNFQKILDEENEENNSDISQDTAYNENREKELEILNAKYSKLYNSKEKIYANIIKEIDVEKKLFFKGSIMSFNLLILKIKCLMKLLKEKFDDFLHKKDERINYELEIQIQKIKHEFIKIYSKINEDSRYEYEIITQIYCKFLYIIAIISNKKEEFTRSFGYLSLGVNMLKVFFIREHIAKYIETYNIYAKLLLLLINKLIADNNINQSLIYINVLSKVCEIGLNIVFNKKLDKKYEYKFNRYNGYNFLFLGFCYEQKKNIQNNIKICLKVYSEAFYYMSKSSRLSIFAGGNTLMTLEKKPLYLSKYLYERLKDKIVYDALEKKREYEQQERLKKQLIEEEKLKEKKYRLQLISCGLCPEPDKLVKMHHRIYKEILTPTNQKLIEKLDDELISYVYKDKHTENNKVDKKNIIKSKNSNLREKIFKTNKKKDKFEKRLPSVDIMKNLCHYKIYNSLMSNDFKEFLLTNKKLEFNHPQKQKMSLDKIQKFLNNKMKIDSNSENQNKDKESYPILKTETNISSENNIKPKVFTLKNNNRIINYKLVGSEKKISRESNSPNYIRISKYQPDNSKSPFTSNKKHSYIVSIDSRNRDKSNSNINNKILTTYSTFTESLGNSNKKKVNFKSLIVNKSRNVDNRQLDKFIFNKKYFKEFLYFEKLTKKELDFQKQFLETKNNNSKMYFKGFDTELTNNGKISKDEIYNSFLILNNKVSKEIDYEKEIKKEMEIKNKPKVVGNVFKSVSNKLEGGKTVKNIMKRVLDKYIREQKKRKTNKDLFTVSDINRKNEYSIMKLNNNIKEINYLLVSKNKEANNKLNNYLKCNDL